MRKTSLLVLVFFAVAAAAWAGTITVTSPRAGDVLCKGRAYQIRWTSSGVSGRVMVRLMQGRVAAAYLSWDTENDGLFDYTVPNIVREGDFTVAVVSRDDSSVRGESGTFRISSCLVTAKTQSAEIMPSITVLAFPSDEMYKICITGIIRVRWSTRGRMPEVVHITLHPYSGSICSGDGTLLSTVRTSAGEQYVYIPASVSDGYYNIRIGQFHSSLFGCSPQFLINFVYIVTEPTRSSSCYRGDSIVVRWRSREPESAVDIGIIGESSFGRRVVDSCLARGTANDGMERVTIPASLPPGLYRIWLMHAVCTVGVPSCGSFSEPFNVSAR